LASDVDIVLEGAKPGDLPIEFPTRIDLTINLNAKALGFDAGASFYCGMSPGAPKGNKNAFKHGHYTAEAIVTRRKIARLLRDARALVKQVS
jgi:hypothetical protein